MPIPDAPTSLFIDTAAFFARFNQRADEHDRAREVFTQIQSGELQYNPLFTSRYVLSEFATLMLRKVSHSAAVNALKTIRNADSFNVLAVDEDAFDRTCEQFRQYSDQQISFVDHTSAILATHWDITHVFTFDRDDFQTLGFTVVPGASGEA